MLSRALAIVARFSKWITIVTVVCLVISVIIVVFDVKRTFDAELMSPSFERHASQYHSMHEMYKMMREDNDISHAYGRYDLTKNVENTTEKIYGYGPLQDPSEFDVRIFIVCNQHGRELITGEVCYSMIRLLQMYVQDGELTMGVGKLQMENVGFWIVPVANPWARNQVERNDSAICRRTNANGVDLNRNYPSIIERHEDGDEEEYQGSEFFSEYESVAVAEFLKYSNAHVLFNVHSGGKDVILPYDGRTDIPPNYAVMVDLAKKARESSGLADCNVGMSSILYGTTSDASLGTLVDYAMDSGQVDLAFTLEVYADYSVENVANLDGLQCQQFFNPPEGEKLIKTQREWVKFILDLCTELLFVIEK